MIADVGTGSVIEAEIVIIRMHVESVKETEAHGIVTLDLVEEIGEAVVMTVMRSGGDGSWARLLLSSHQSSRSS